MGERENKERSQILEHYKSIWRDYETKYKSFPLAQTLLSLQAENKQLEEKLKEEEEECGKLKEKLANFSESSCNELRNFNTFAVMIAGKKLETCSVLKECWEITSDISKKEEDLQKMQMKSDPKTVSEVTTKSTQQQDVSNRNQQDKSESSDDSMLISVIRQREDTEPDVQMQETDSSKSVQDTSSRHSRAPPFSIVPTITQSQSSQGESMICSSAGEQHGRIQKGVIKKDQSKAQLKQVPKVNEQGDHEKAVSSGSLQRQMLINTVQAVSNLNRRPSQMMPKSYTSIPSIEEMRAKVASPVQKPPPKLPTESSLKTHQIQIPSISKLSINPTTKISQNSVSSVTNQTSDHPRRVFGRTSTAELLQASVGNQLRKGTTAAGSNNHQGPVTHMTQETTQEGTGTDRQQELRNPFPQTTQNSKSRMMTEGSQSQEIEMQEIEPPQPLNTPKTPKAATITMEVSSDSSTPDSLQGSVASSGGLSPFDLAKHSERIQLFHKSPGLPPGLYTSKPNFTSQSVTTTTSPNPTITSLGTQSFMNMQEADASSFRMNDFNMYGGETNQSTGSEGFGEFNLNETGFGFNTNTKDSGGPGIFNFEEPLGKSAALSGFNFGNSFQFGSNSTSDNKCENFLSVFENDKGATQMESQESSFTFSFGGFQ